MTVLVLGASGQVGRGVAAGLGDRGFDVRPAGRAPRRGWVRFDWDDPATYAAAVAGVEAVHLLPPQGDPDPLPRVEAFLAEAREAGVRRVVLLSSSAIEAGDSGLGEVHAALAASWPEWGVLRPSWFMQNFTGHHQQAERIREHGEIVTATGDGRIAFVDVADIAAVGVHALTAAESPQAGLLVTGPEALSYDEVAATVSRVSGRTVRHRKVAEPAVAQWLTEEGVPAQFATMLAAMDAALATGAGDVVSEVVERSTGRAPRSFKDLAEEHWG
jgi:uncharacterized protein YbjT (DUF2867 family)